MAKKTIVPKTPAKKTVSAGKTPAAPATTNRKPAAAPAEEEKKDALARRPETLPAVASTPDFEADAGQGGEGISAQDLAIPRVTILQSGSPQVKKSDGAYVEGAAEGDIFDNINSELYDGGEGIVVVPVAYRRAYIEWIPKSQGGGFVADHGADPSIMAKTRKGEEGTALANANLLPNGHEIVQHAEYYCLLVEEETGAFKQVVISMSKTQLKKAKKWNSILTSLQVPRGNGIGTYNPAVFYSSYKLTTVPETKDDFSWMGWKVEKHLNTVDLPGGNDIYFAAKSFKDAVRAGAVKVADPQQVDNFAQGAEGTDEGADNLL